MLRYFRIFAPLIFLALWGGYSCERKNVIEIEGMAHVPAGKFYMGNRGDIEKAGVDAGDGRVGLDVGVDEIPRHAVRLNGFYIDKYEVANSQYKKFIDAAGRSAPDNPTHPGDPYIWKNGIYPEGMGDYPVTLVSYEDVSAYCKWVGKRLPTEEEWEKACRGNDGRKWPWGDDFQVTKANVRELDLKRASPVGAFPSDLSPYGVYDMAGNVREWTSSWYTAYPGSKLKRSTFGEKFRVMRGGSWLHSSVPESRCAVRGLGPPEKAHRVLGFRCARDE